jgi:hypothetical protein
MMKTLHCAGLALALLGGLAGGRASAADEMQVSGKSVLTVVEEHVIPSSTVPTGFFVVGKNIGMATAPGWFDAMELVVTGTHVGDTKQGKGVSKGDFLWKNGDGSVMGTYIGNVTYASEAGKGTFEGDLELIGGSGRYGNVRGHAKIHGQYVGKEISDEWSGTITGMGKQ